MELHFVQRGWWTFIRLRCPWILPHAAYSLLILTLFTVPFSLMCVCNYKRRVGVCFSSATPGCAACALATGAPSACVRTSSTLSCCRQSGPNSTPLCSEGLFCNSFVTSNWSTLPHLSECLLFFCFAKLFCKVHVLHHNSLPHFSFFSSFIHFRVLFYNFYPSFSSFLDVAFCTAVESSTRTFPFWSPSHFHSVVVNLLVDFILFDCVTVASSAYRDVTDHFWSCCLVS